MTTRAEKFARAAKARRLLNESVQQVGISAETASENEAPPAPEHPETTLAHLLPKRWQQPPARGDLVFYRNERFWVEVSTLSFMESVWIRIGDRRPLRDGLFDDKRVSFYVHVDELTAVPADYNKRAARLPTLASIARADRAKKGERDVGDDVAIRLRSCNSLEETYIVASEYLGVPTAELRAKYERLNPGQQRMNLGNRMRAKWKKEHV